jgi:hypothetical protein
MTQIASRSRHRARLFRLGLSCTVALAAIGCTEELGVPLANQTPIAKAAVLGMAGSSIQVEYSGMPVAFTLDGSGSIDPDGTIIKYTWLSGDVVTPAASGGASTAGASGAAGSSSQAGAAASPPAGGIGGVHLRAVPAGQAPDWPDDVMQPMVSLDAGQHTFVLWVTDNKGAVSLPSTVKITVGQPVDAIMTCEASVPSSVAPACSQCVCSASDQCRTATLGCNSDCWTLIDCIARLCPTLDQGCIVMNCPTAIAGGTAATAVGPCLMGSCSASCTAP